MMEDLRTISLVDYGYNNEAIIIENQSLKHNNKILIGTVIIFVGCIALAAIYLIRDELNSDNIKKNEKS